MASSQRQNSQRSASPSNPSISSLQYPNQPDFPLRLQIQRLRQDLAHAQKQIQEYEGLFASLYNNICIKCRANFEKYAPAGLATSSTAGAVVVSPSSNPKFSLRPSNSPRSSAPSNRVPFWHRVFKGHHTMPICPTDSVSSDIIGRPGVSQLSNVKASDFSQATQPVSLASGSIQPSSQYPISPPETSTDIPNQLDWSVEYNNHVKRALNLKLEHVLTHGAVVIRVVFSPDGKYLAVGVVNGMTYIYDVKTGVKSCFLADNSETIKPGIWCLCFSPDGKYLAVGLADGQLRVWEIAKNRTRNIFQGHTSTIGDLDFSPDSRFLVSCSYDGTVRIWRIRDGFSKLLEDNSASFFSSVKFNPDGGYIAAGNGDGMLRIWNVRTSRLVEKWTAHGNVVRSVAFTLDGKGLVSSSADYTWKYWDISSISLAEPGYGTTKGSVVGQKSKVAAHTLDDVSSISVSPDGQWVASGSGVPVVRIWDLRNAALQCTLKGHQDCVWSVDFCPTGNYLASGSVDGRVELWRYEEA